MNLATSIGCYILSVYFGGFNCSATFELPRNSPYIVDRNNNGNSRKWEWIPQLIENVTKTLSLDLRALPDGHVDRLAQSHVLFYLYTKHNPYQPQVLTMDSLGSVQNSYFAGGISTVFVTHGWINNAYVSSCTSIRDAYLAGPGPVNVIVVDWSPFSIALYHWSVAKVETVGNQVARMIEFLRSYAKLDLRVTTLVGHSLGAHVMGVAGRTVKGTVNQIFGLDPARPMFEDSTNQIRLSRYSARNVQVIHTNANQLGLSEPLGHADFYPNGGSNQPGCAALDLLSSGACSHGRAFFLLAESLNSRVGFQALRCRRGEDVFKGQCRGQVGTMGGLSNQINEVGVFYLKTGDSSPFAYKLRLKKN